MPNVRKLLSDFSLNNNLYATATVSVFTVNPTTLMPTQTLAPLYSDPVFATTIANPQILDGQGKWIQPVFVDQPVIMQIGNTTAANHTTGIEGQLGAFKSDWVSGLLYVTGDTIRDGLAGTNTSNVYYCAVPHVAGVFATDLAAARWIIYVSATAVAGGVIAAAVAASLTAVSAAGYLTANQTITLSGAATGSGTTAIPVTLVATGVGAGTYTKVTVNGAGQATAGGAINATDITGALVTPLPVANGGSGAVTLTNHGILLGSAASPLRALAPNTAGFQLTDGGAGVDPSWTAPFFSIDSGNLSGTRVVGTTYTNSSGRPMWIEILGTSTAISTTLALTVAGRVRVANSTPNNGFSLPVNGIVPAGATYIVSVPTGSLTVNNWEETT